MRTHIPLNKTVYQIKICIEKQVFEARYYISLMDVAQDLIFVTPYYIYFQFNDAY